MSVVHSAIQRMLLHAASSPRSTAMNSAPTSGRKVTIDRMGASEVHRLALRRQA